MKNSEIKEEERTNRLKATLDYLRSTYISFRFREIIRDVSENAQQIVQMTEERKNQALEQQKILEEQVTRRTADLRTTLDNLKSAQAQLIQSEKMASLGELTAGIAHEIRNPLNFVKNFSEVKTDLLEELRNGPLSRLPDPDRKEAIEIVNDLHQNLEKINHHGKRADAIVQGMLQHSRMTKGQKEPTDINALADEYLRLAYHRYRAKDKLFNVSCKTDLDETIGKKNVIPQDIGRVLLNLINKAFYAVNEKQKQNIPGYEPTVTIKTRNIFSPSAVQPKAEMTVWQNGIGIPEKIKDKIFQPFYTTKPAGTGTGLGLSLSYDIITKEHGGEIRVESKEGEGAEFIVSLRA